MKKNNKNIVVWSLIITMFLIMMQVSSNTIKSSSAPNEYTFSQLENEVASSKIVEAEINEAEGLITGETSDGKRFKANTSRIDDRAGELFDKYNVPYEYSKVKGTNTLAAMFINILPLLLIIGVSMLIFRSMQGGGRGGAMSFGKSRAKMLTENTNRVTFEDVAGVESAKEDLKEVVEFLEDPSRFTRLGARIPTGALLVGPPGTGKTLLARAVAGEAGVPFFTISGSDFVEMFVGVGASRVRDMFADARKNAPCIIFIDEIDAVGRHRGVGTSGGHEEREQTLNQLLVEMDGFQGDEGVIIIAATNRPDVLDKALLRPGRFDRQIEVPYPDVLGREKILEVHMKGKPIAADLDVKYIARGTPGFSGADLMNLVNEAALLSARRNKLKITMREFEDARDKVLMGAERRSLSMTDEERQNTAYHEAGHAIVGLNMKGSLPIHKATIIP